MGNDQNLFPEKRPHGVWKMDGDNQVLVIERHSTYDDSWREVWRGPVTEEAEELIKLMIGEIPNRPPVVLSKRTRLKNLIGPYLDNEYWTDERVEEFFDEVMEIIDE